MIKRCFPIDQHAKSVQLMGQKYILLNFVFKFLYMDYSRKKLRFCAKLVCCWNVCENNPAFEIYETVNAFLNSKNQRVFSLSIESQSFLSLDALDKVTDKRPLRG